MQDTVSKLSKLAVNPSEEESKGSSHRASVPYEGLIVNQYSQRGLLGESRSWIRLFLYSFLDDFTVLTKVAILSKAERALLVNSPLARTDAYSGRTCVLDFKHDRLW